jgi:hypothetical protein
MRERGEVKMSEERTENAMEAKNTFEFFAEIMESELVTSVSWDPQKSREERTRLVLAVMSYWRLMNDEYIFLNTRHFESVVDFWKKWMNSAEEKYREEISQWIRTYEERLKHKKEIGEIGERFVDLSSSYHKVPINFSFILEYEASPYWSAIIYNFRKLLSVLAPVKVGIFHLPKLFSTSKPWVQDEETTKIKWEDKVLDSDKPDELIDDMKNELKLNALEHPNTVYLIILIHSPTEERVDLYGYLLWKETTGEVHSETLSAPRVEAPE